MKKAVAIEKAREVELYGAKAVSLGEAARHGILIPPAIAFSGDLTEAVASQDAKAIARVKLAIASVSPPFAVRSSVVDEDSAEASFAGQHMTILNVHSPSDVADAIRQVWWSANSDAAITYRQRLAVFTQPNVGVVVQTLLSPEVAGVMFTENPVTGADERMIEANFGLGQTVVCGIGVPDHFRIDRSGKVLERKPGYKRVAIRALPNGGTFEEQTPEQNIEAFCLDDARLVALGRLALECEKVFGPRLDIEFAFQQGVLYLLQCRAITTSKERSCKLSPAAPPVRDPVSALKRAQLFADLDRRQSEQIARILKRNTFAKGDTVIREGSGGAAFFVIETGQADVSRKGKFIETLGPGDCFGEIALLDGGPRTATIRAATDLVCYGVTFWEFRPLIEKNGTIAWRLLQALARRLRARDS